MNRSHRFVTRFLATTALCVAPALVGSPGWAADSDPAQAGKYKAEADKMVANGDLKGAEIELKNAVKAAPDDPQLRLELAKLELRLNDIDGAEIELKAAREHGADEAKVIPLLGRTYLMQGKYDQLLQDLPVRDEDPPEARAATLSVRAEAQIQLKKIDDARSSLVAAEQLEPQSVAPKLGLAKIAYAQGQLDDALKKADEIIQINPSADAYILKGEILNRKGDHTGAIGQFDQAIKTEPNNIAGYIDRAQTEIGLKDDAKAEADVKTLLGINNRSVPGNYLEALILARRKDFTGADTILTKIAPAFPNFPRGYYLQAVVKSALKQLEQAEAAITAYLAAVPDDVVGEKVQADIMLRKGNSAGAAEVLEKVTAQSPDDFAALTMLGQAYMGARKPQQAVEAFEKAQKLAPDNPAVLRGLALNHLATGDSAEGTSELEKAVQLAPDDAPSTEALILVYMRAKNWDKAKSLIADLKKRKPDDPLAGNMTGMLELAQNHLPEAQAAYQAVEKQFPDFAPAKLQLGYIATLQGHSDEAKAKYREVLDKDPNNAQALQRLSQLLEADKKPDDVVDLWLKAHHAQPDSVPAALGLVQAYMVKKDMDSALAIIRDMQIRQPNEPRLFAMRAELELQKKDAKDAVVSLQRLSELRPQDPAVRSDLAKAQALSGDTNGAIATIGEARKLDPNNIGLAIQEIAYLGQRNPDDAIQAAQRLAAQMPDQPRAQVVEGDYLQSQKRPAEAIAAYNKALQVHPSLLIVSRLAGMAMKDGKPAQAGKLLKDWVNAHPDDLAAQVEMANFSLQQKDYSDAKTRFEAALKSRPNDPLILNNLAYIYQRDGDARALDFAQKAHDAAPQSPAIDDTLGWIMLQKDDTANGLKYLEQAHSGAPDDLDISYHLAVALDKTGKKPEATDLLKKAIAVGRDFDSKKDAEALLAQLSKS
jgi:putative PEP-CTERM system TPR-repeat lipoprotein